MHELRSFMPDLNMITCLAILPLSLAMVFPLIITPDLFIINKLDLYALPGTSWDS